MKIWCEKCEGRRKINTARYEYDAHEKFETCLICEGKGYTEQPETQRLIELGKAVEKAFECGYTPTFDDCWTLDSPKQLLEWYKEQEVNNGRTNEA